MRFCCPWLTEAFQRAVLRLFVRRGLFEREDARRATSAHPLRCPKCAAGMRIVAFITEAAVIDRILTHLRRVREPARGPPPAARALLLQAAPAATIEIHWALAEQGETLYLSS